MKTPSSWTQALDQARRWRVYASCAVEEGDHEMKRAAIELAREALEAAARLR